jgi:hypothetical protein
VACTKIHLLFSIELAKIVKKFNRTINFFADPAQRIRYCEGEDTAMDNQMVIFTGKRTYVSCHGFSLVFFSTSKEFLARNRMSLRFLVGCTEPLFRSLLNLRLLTLATIRFRSLFELALSFRQRKVA